MDTSKTMNGASSETPLFLRKTYHMIDTCDPEVACWSEDGETFVVKNTNVFEHEVIPQFFKHSKFSSFVRQLNFYGFRKIKYADTIKIDYKLEAETANFWRFRHEKFRRGHPEMLIEIKRSNSSSNTADAVAPSVATAVAKVSTPAVVKSSPVVVVEENAMLRSEVSSLKNRIDAMTKNIDELTEMVKKVTIQQHKEEDGADHAGIKRKKVISPDAAISCDQIATVSAPSMDLDEFETLSFPPIAPPVASIPRTSSDTFKLSDEDFVDQLFTEFGNEDTLDGLLMDDDLVLSPEPDGVDPKLLKRLANALKVLPKEMQEMIVDRLVASIVGADSLEKNIKAASTLGEVAKIKAVAAGGKQAPNQVPPSPTLGATHRPDLPMPLAAATLAALLKQYGESHYKALPPAIPIHA